MTMMASSEATLFEPNAERFVKQALNTIGHVSETTGYLAHEIQVVPALLLPDFVKDMIDEKMRDNKRKRVLAKKGQ
uniref:Uncharacterized protein n=1 Tax=Acrobeloides nanus TaxID=290746 RepID=A0A914ECP2_9BILA